MIFYSFFSLLVFMLSGSFLYYQGNRYIRYFVTALVIFFSGWILTGLQETGLLPGESKTHFGYIGTVVMMGFFSLSLTDRYNSMKETIAREQRKMIQTQKFYGEQLRQKVLEKIRDLLSEKNSLESFVKGMEKELDLARSIRKDMLSHQNFSNKSVSYYFYPSANVGSDFLYFFKTENNRETGIILCDANSRGIHSMFSFLILKTLLLFDYFCYKNINHAGRRKKRTAR